MNIVIFTNRTLTFNNNNTNEDLKSELEADLKGADGGWDPEIRRSAGDSPRHVFIGDANNDGYNDIVTANYNSDNISILLWNEILYDWDPQITRSVGNSPYDVFIEDANNDGFNDIVVSNLLDVNVSILLWNEISGNWDPRIKIAVGLYPRGLFIGDSNNDGFNDIITACGDDNVSIVLWNNSIGDWDPQIKIAVGNIGGLTNTPSDVFIGDANNDGYNDIVTANFDDDTISILLWDEIAEDWESETTEPVLRDPLSVFIGDANNDGYNDIVCSGYQLDGVSILLWDEITGDWEPEIRRSSGSRWSVFIGDVNNDGLNDIVTANPNDNNLSILLWNNTMGNWESKILISVGEWPIGLFIGDANNDGINDIVSANSNSDDVSIILRRAPYIKIFSPESKIYGRAMSGYYLATFGFENDPNGGFPREWTPESNGGTCQVIQSLGDHEKVVELYDSSVPDDYIGMANNFTSKQTEGSVEFYFRSNNTNKQTDIYLYENATDEGIRLTIKLNALWYYKSMTYLGLGTPIENNIWYHFRIEFNSTTSIFWLWVNGMRITYVTGGDYPFQNNNTGMNHLSLTTFVYDMNYSSYFDAIGYSWDPSYNIGDNLNEGLLLNFKQQHTDFLLNWTAYSLDGQNNVTILGNTVIPLPDDGLHSIQIFGNLSSGLKIKSDIIFFEIDTKNPDIVIHSPNSGEVFGFISPKYNVSIEEINLDSMWYTIDGGATNVSITKLTGYIDQHLWIDAPLGPINIRFFTNDTANHLSYEDVVITKARLLSIDIIDLSFSSTEFNIKFMVYNESGDKINFATIQIWWDGYYVSNEVQNLGNGLYLISLDPITVLPSEDPILLNMTISASGYEDKYFEIYIAVDPDTLQKDGGKPTQEFLLPLIITLSAVSAGVIIGLVSIFWYRRKKREL